MDITGDDPRPPSHERGVRPASSASAASDEAGPAAAHAGPPWLVVPDDEAPRRRRWVLAAAVLPWMVLIVLVARTPTDTVGPAATRITPSPSAADAPTPVPSGAVAAPERASTDERVVGVRATGGRTGVGLADVAAVAIPVVRAWLGAAEPLVIDGLDRREYGWIEHAVVEAVDHPGQGAAVASVLAVVLPTDGSEWLDAEVLRVAVPLRIMDREVRPAGQPWLLPPPILTLTPLETTPIPDDGDLASVVGLELAELYGHVEEIHGFETTEAWPLVADVTIRDPLDGQLRRQQIWIRASQTSFPVAGWFAVPPAGVGFPEPPSEGDRAAPGDSASPSPEIQSPSDEAS